MLYTIDYVLFMRCKTAFFIFIHNLFIFSLLVSGLHPVSHLGAYTYNTQYSRVWYYTYTISISVAHAFAFSIVVRIIMLKIRSLFHSWYIYYLVYVRVCGIESRLRGCWRRQYTHMYLYIHISMVLVLSVVLLPSLMLLKWQTLANLCA